MKAKHFFCYLAVIAVLFTACKKDKDYRDKWVGDWDFTTIDYHKYGIVHDPFIEETDTTYFIGTIEKHGTNRLKITFNPDAIEPFPIKGLMYPKVDDSGTISYPEYISSLLSYYYGTFSGSISEDAIIINYKSEIGANGPLGYRDWETHTIQGIKINK